MKKCLKCNKEKPDELFGVDKSKKDNRSPYCRHCRNIFEKNQRVDGKRSYKKKIKPTKEKSSEYMRNSRYRLSNSDYQDMLISQKELCLICNKFMKNPNVDHCHETGKVRGLLCNKCNMALGLLKDSIENLKNAILYLKNNNSLTKPSINAE